MTGKKCSKCKRFKSFSEFYKTKNTLCGRTSACKQCKREYAQTDHAKSMNHKRWIKYVYNISAVTYNNLFLDQNGCCGMCGRHQSILKRRLDVDHNHKTGEIRGLLCNYCNKIVERHINSPSWFKDPVVVRKLRSYLK